MPLPLRELTGPSRVLWVAATQELTSAVRSAKQFLTYGASDPFQYAITEALRLPDAYFDTFHADHRRKPRVR